MPKFEIRRSGGRVQGPFSGTEIRAMAESGRIAPTDELRSQGSEKWIPASKVRGVREHLPPGSLDFSGFDVGGAPSPDPQPFGAPDWVDPEPPPAAASEPAEEPLPSSAPPVGGTPRTDGGSPPTTAPVSGEGGYVPQYGVLRWWARSFERWGWRLVRLALAVCAGLSVGTLFAILARRWTDMGARGDALAVATGGAVVVATISADLLLGGVIQGMKSRAALDQPFLRPIVLMITVPLVLAALTSLVGGYLSVGFLVATLLGLSLAATGFGLVIFGEWLFAHADIASNSWRRQPLPTSIHR
jgi:hypothetical protein